MDNPIVAPPIRVLDYGYTAPNPVDYGRMAVAQMQPLQESVAQGNEAKNRFLLSNLENQRAMQLAQYQHQTQMELAKWQHQAQIQRSQILYQRMIDAAKIRAQSQMDALKEKGMLDDIKAKNAYLSRIGGGTIARGDNESDAAYGQRLDNAIKSTMTNNIATDAKAAFSIQRQIKSYNDYLSDPRVTKAIGPELQTALANPGVQAQASNMVNSGLARWLLNVAGEKNAGIIQDALDQAGPQNRDAILQRAGLDGAYQAFQNSALQQASYAYLKAAGSPVAKQIAGANENLGILKQQLQDIAMMPGDNGRSVPKPWWGQVQSSVDDMTLHDRLLEQQQKASMPPHVAAAAAANAAPVVAHPNPVVAPAAVATSPSDPYAKYFNNGEMILPGTAAAERDSGNLPIPNPNRLTPITPAVAASFGIPTPTLAANPSPIGAPSRFVDVSRFSNGDAAYAPLPVVRAPQPIATQAGVAGVASPNNILPPLPVLQQVPTAVNVSPTAPVANPVITPLQQDGNPYDPVMQSLNMQAMYGQY